MAFKPANSANTSNNFEQRTYPAPKSGSRKARVSLIVDLGVQERDDLWEKDGKIVAEGTEGAECKPQKDCQQIAIFADLVADNVDYGGNIGKQQYRLLLNNTFAGKVRGISFTASPPKDAKGNILQGKAWGFHPQNLLTKISKAVGKPEVIESMDIEKLLGQAFMADVEVKEVPSGKEDKDGNEIIYKNVNFKGAAKIPMIETGEEDQDGNIIEEITPVADLKENALCITFEDAKKEDIRFIRGNLLKMIKLAKNYNGSKIQKAIEEFEREKDDSNGEVNNATGQETHEEPQVAKVEKSLKKTAAKKQIEEEDDAPF